ncbi:ArpU family phage packaging/lysis transcriptional regulator [Paenibacillus terrae]|uniref:ArpU family phage packaging/lysis transcriptional regulator n=1 Tax=Paenibacillus terrae TaxID=159743 RepID=UPI0005CBDE3F|nr:ArpU family phage packaging/lysis transcriptional regulator [Paenibacillus terrae]
MGQQSFEDFELEELDPKKTKSAVEGVLQKYRMYRYLVSEDREASTTAAYSDMPRSSPTNVTSDQTASIAIHNVDAQSFRRSFVERVERAVNALPKTERFLIQKRYMNNDAEYITDGHVYNFEFQPPCNKDTYGKIRRKAFYRLILKLDDLKILRISEIFNPE